MATNLARPRRVLNKNPAPIQITAEQILRESRDIQQQHSQTRAPKRKINDASELDDYRSQKRKNFEHIITLNNNNNVWSKYAAFEESQNDFARARSAFERGLVSNYRNHTLWLKYAEFEMKNKFVSHARNVWDRAVELLPRVDQLWYKYVHMEEMLGNVAAARRVFDRWMKWMPDQQAWISYVKFEMRYKEVGNAREVFERFVGCHGNFNAESWIRYAKFEVRNGEMERARKCYERAVDKFDDDEEEAGKLYVAFAEFEERCCNAIENARRVYKYGLNRIPEGSAKEELYKKFNAFEKVYGDKESIEDGIVGKRRTEYEEEVRNNPFSYDAWFDYIRLEESCGDKQRIENVYKRALANVPPANEKRYWQRYIYVWINYFLYLELDAENVDGTREAYTSCLKLIPHKKFSFSKVWIMGAEFEIRQSNIDRARRILGQAIGMAPKEKIFKKYIEIELQLGNIDRCRKLYQKYLEWSPDKCNAWIRFAQLERTLGESERARAIFEIAIDQPTLDMPELLWKAYIDIEISGSEYERARILYERLLNRTKHVNVWISYAMFEASTSSGLHDDESDDEATRKSWIERARGVFERGLDYFRNCAPDLKADRAMLLESWLRMEKESGTEIGEVDMVLVKMPKQLKRRVESEGGYREYIDYLFPEETQSSNFEILEAAYKWKKQQQK